VKGASLEDGSLRGPFTPLLKMLPVPLLCSLLDCAHLQGYVPACRSFDLRFIVKDQWWALSCDKPPRTSLTTSYIKVIFLDLPSDEDARGMCAALISFSQGCADNSLRIALPMLTLAFDE
jgi:hypothetical protein